ncbi:malate synthase [Apiospora arundinis]
MLPEPTISVLGTDPSWRNCVLNGNAFQQDAIQSFNGWQYACFYSTPRSSELGDREPLYVHLSRRKLPIGKWETIVFEDYPQTTDDGHNTVQLGICPGDGTIHLSYDHHCDEIRYRHSIPNLATDPESHTWSAEHFTATLHHLPGLENAKPHAELLSYITYPRFGQLGPDLWFSFRTGKAGLGDDHLYLYSASRGAYSSLSSSFPKLVGNNGVDNGIATPTTTTPFLKGVQNNPYIHGLDVRDGTLYVTWVYRDFVWYEGWDDPADTKHKQQAGPNSAANNRDLCFAYSSPSSSHPPLSSSPSSSSPSKTATAEEEEETTTPSLAGQVWRNGTGDVVADLRRGESITPFSPGVTAFRIPKGAGLTNQEAQAVDHDGGVHVLNRDCCHHIHKDDDDDKTDREVKWKHYYRDPVTKAWTSRALPCGYVSGKRGRLAVSRDGDLYFILPGVDNGLSIWKAAKRGGYSAYEQVWSSSSSSSGEEEAFPLTEPLVDTYRLDHDNVLSVFTRRCAEAKKRSHESAGNRQAGEEEGRRVDVVVLDFQL